MSRAAEVITLNEGGIVLDAMAVVLMMTRVITPRHGFLMLASASVLYMIACLFYFPLFVPVHAGCAVAGLWFWWNNGGGDDTKKRLRKLKKKFPRCAAWRP